MRAISGKLCCAASLCVVNKHLLIDFQRIIHRYEDTYASYETVNETYGNFARWKRKAQQTPLGIV